MSLDLLKIHLSPTFEVMHYLQKFDCDILTRIELFRKLHPRILFLHSLNIIQSFLEHLISHGDAAQLRGFVTTGSSKTCHLCRVFTAKAALGCFGEPIAKPLDTVVRWLPNSQTWQEERPLV
jgi:hypothetical protein